MAVDPNDVTQQQPAVCSQESDLLDCIWVFITGVLVGVIFAAVTVFAAMYLASIHPELQSLN